ncbi:hypothetical protein Efla_007824 [Eimeria flavescens]
MVMASGGRFAVAEPRVRLVIFGGCRRSAALFHTVSRISTFLYEWAVQRFADPVLRGSVDHGAAADGSIWVCNERLLASAFRVVSDVALVPVAAVRT